ncbi:MAG: VOC family protein [Acidimicrobiia bacterium]|nr:VOC family protein [Acidimicrobiia bacterium]
MAVHELRLVISPDDYERAVTFYRDRLGLPEVAQWGDNGKGVLLAAGRATLEILEPEHAAHVDEVEVGKRVAGAIRVAFEVDDAASMTAELTAGGATVLAEPATTPWNSLNSRLDAPGGLQLTIFEELD